MATQAQIDELKRTMALIQKGVNEGIASGDITNKNVDKIFTPLQQAQSQLVAKAPSVAQVSAPASTKTLPAQSNYQSASSTIGAKTLPDAKAPQSNLLAFNNALSAAINMAKQARSSNYAGLMAPYRGVAPASDFNSILGNLSQASNSFSSDLVTNASNAYDADIKFQQEQYLRQQEQQESLRNNIQNLALDASKAGASDQQINAIINARSVEDAIQQTSGIYAKSGEDVIQTSVRTDAAGNKYSDIILQKPNGEITTKSIFLGNEGGGRTGSGSVSSFGSGFAPDGGSSVTFDTLSPTALNVIAGKVSLDGLTPSEYKKVTDELRQIGYYDKKPPYWFRQIIEEDLQMSLTLEALQKEWDKYRSGGSSDSQGDLENLLQQYPEQATAIREAYNGGYSIQEIRDFLQ